MCECVCLSLANDSLGTIQVIIIKFGTVTASDIIMHHMLSTLTLTIQRSHRYTKYLKIFPCFQAMPITFAVKIVRLKVYIICSQSDDLDLHKATIASQN